MPLEYYCPEHDLNGTARELCRDAYKGYIDEVEALRKIREYVKTDLSRNGDKSVTPLDLLKINALIEEAEEKEVHPETVFSIGRMKYDLLDNFTNFEDFRFYEDETKTVDVSTLYENNTFVFVITENTAEGGRIGTACIDRDEFLKMSHTELERTFNECYFYSTPVEEEEEEREIDK